nr:hypothetical protein [Tanacetum cinerariifolium]
PSQPFHSVTIVVFGRRLTGSGIDSSFLIRPERFRLIVHHGGILSKNCEREK